MIVGAPPSVRRMKPEHRASRCSHPGRVLLRLARVDCRSTALGAKGKARTPSRPLFAPGAGAPTQEARADCRSTAPGAKGEARTPSQPLFAPGAGAPTGEARVDCRSTAPGAKGKPKHRASRCSHPGRVLLQERRVLNVGAPPSVRRVSQNTEPALVRTRGGCSYGGSAC